MNALSVLSWVLIAAFSALALYSGFVLVKALWSARRPRMGYGLKNNLDTPLVVQTKPGNTIVRLEPGESTFISPEAPTPPPDPVSTAAAKKLEQELFGDFDSLTADPFDDYDTEPTNTGDSGDSHSDD